MMNRFPKKYHQYTEHIDSINFKNAPEKVKKVVSKEDFETIVKLPFIRLEEQRKLLINEAFDEDKILFYFLVSLDSLPDKFLLDIYKDYHLEYKDIDFFNLEYENDDELREKIMFCLIPEILWCHGDDSVESLIFKN